MNPVEPLQCRRCGYQWTPRKSVVSMCPKCKSKRWSTPRTNEQGRRTDLAERGADPAAQLRERYALVRQMIPFPEDSAQFIAWERELKAVMKRMLKEAKRTGPEKAGRSRAGTRKRP